MHPLINILFPEGWTPEGMRKEKNALLIQYLSERAEWLKQEVCYSTRIPDRIEYSKLINQAFDLSTAEKEEFCYCYASKVLPDGFGGCQNCGRKIKPAEKEKYVSEYKDKLFVSNGIDKVIKMNPPDKIKPQSPELPKRIDFNNPTTDCLSDKINELITALSDLKLRVERIEGGR